MGGFFGGGAGAQFLTRSKSQDTVFPNALPPGTLDPELNNLALAAFATYQVNCQLLFSTDAVVSADGCEANVGFYGPYTGANGFESINAYYSDGNTGAFVPVNAYLSSVGALTTVEVMGPDVTYVNLQVTVYTGTAPINWGIYCLNAQNFGAATTLTLRQGSNVAFIAV